MSQAAIPRRVRVSKGRPKGLTSQELDGTLHTVAILDEGESISIEDMRRVLPASVTVVNWQSKSASRATALVVSDASVDERVLERAKALQIVVKLESGRGTVDKAACVRRDIHVHHVPDIGAISVAEHTILLMLALQKEYDRAASLFRSGVVVGGLEPTVTTQTSYAYNWVGLQKFDALYGKTVGLVGLGNIGREVAVRLRAFGADVVYTKRSRLSSSDEQELSVTFLTLQELLEASEIVSLHLRFYPETERLMGEKQFRSMKPGSFFVNTARGRLVDENALIEAIEGDHLGGAALDVFWYEPLPHDSPLLRTRNLILTPHTGGIPAGIGHELEAAGRLIARRL